MAAAVAGEGPARCVMLQAREGTGAEDTSVIVEGDLVVAYESVSRMKPVYVHRGRSHDSSYGRFPLTDWIGLPFGSKVSTDRGWLYLLRPTPELWTLILAHRTQILYVADISLICTYLDLAPGCVVAESGTGSASLTHALARAVAPHGRVHTFEFHLPRADKAREELTRHGMGDLVTVQHRDTERDGFPSELHGAVDAVSLDLPHPWRVIESADACLRPGSPVCCFSPCIEQVQRTCLALEERGFQEIRTFECLQRVFDVCNERHVRDLDGGLADTSSAYLPGEPGGRGTKRGREGADGEGKGDGEGEGEGEGGGGGSRGRGAGRGRGRGRRGPSLADVPEECFSKVVVCRPQVAARGHTGYLTFARKSTVPVVLGGAARDPGVEGGDGGDDAEDEDVPSSQGAGAEGADE